ncbi:MAG: zinc ribbon domain-containing protein [Actinobacteria bacterium]|nr:MAG: zinc ribbon domain-containing protein [Actinomycetota bacterium]
MQDIANLFSPITTHPLFQLSWRLCLLFSVILWLALIYWTYRDADRRGAMAIYWAAVVLFFNFPGWIVYLIVRPPEYEEDMRERELEIRTKEAVLARSDVVCPACMKPVKDDFLICPYCQKKLKKSCPNCAKPLNMNWVVCPYCKTSL